MLTYITIFVVCVILAVVIRFVLKAISESSHSLSTSREPIDIVHVTPANKKARATRDTTTGPQRTRSSVAKTTKQVDSAWPGSVNQVREQQPQYAISGGAGSHCSLYDVETATPAANHDQKVGWPYREEEHASSGKSYKVKRKVAPETSSPDTLNKPWGW